MSRFRSGSLRTSIVVGVVVALVLAGAGAFYAFSQQRSWVAESMLVVLPSADLDEATSASYYETLSRGQIVATFAEVAGTQRFEQQGDHRAHDDAGPQAAASVATHRNTPSDGRSATSSDAGRSGSSERPSTVA